MEARRVQAKQVRTSSCDCPERVRQRLIRRDCSLRVNSRPNARPPSRALTRTSLNEECRRSSGRWPCRNRKRILACQARMLRRSSSSKTGEAGRLSRQQRSLCQLLLPPESANSYKSRQTNRCPTEGAPPSMVCAQNRCLRTAWPFKRARFATIRQSSKSSCRCAKLR